MTFVTTTAFEPSVPGDEAARIAQLIAEPREEAELLLDLVDAALRDGQAAAPMIHMLNAGLKMARSYMTADGWTAFCARAQAHPLVALLKQDPFIARVNDKPRGYAGDAVMIDMIYRTGESARVRAAATEFGREIYDVTNVSIASQGVRERREYLARLVDAAADAHTNPTILAVAAGHLREAALSRAFAAGRIGRWVALDQDPDSIAEIERSLGGRVETVPQSIRVILNGSFAVTDANLIYAAGLYDYLPRALAIRLTRKLAAMLRPGGRLMFANFASDIWEAGAMEAIMDWTLILRSPAEMRDIAAHVGDGYAAHHWSGVHGAVHYCELVRR